jgi:hypothetical protein
MLVMRDCAIEPGDILCLVSNSSKLLARVKRATQFRTTSRNKHGHNEVISVFVCTGKNKHGIICHNYEGQLSLPEDTFASFLGEQNVKELTDLLLRFSHKEFTVEQIRQTLVGGPQWMRRFNKQIAENISSEELIERFISAPIDKRKLIQLIIAFWRASGHAEILPVIHSSLLVFKHNDSLQRQMFLNAYLEQVKITESLRNQGKQRTSFHAAIKSVLLSSAQDQKDKEQHQPAVGTFCSRNVIEVLNQIDPKLVNRGRNCMPKCLEAGLREATQAKKYTEGSEERFKNDFEALIAEQEKYLPRFRLQILPATGTELVSTLLAVVDKEIIRIESKRWANAADIQKIDHLKQVLEPFRNPRYQKYPVHLQVDLALKLIASIFPILHIKTGVTEVLGDWVFTRSYANVRAFARTQGIFDGDIRATIEKLQQQPLLLEAQAEEALSSDQSYKLCEFPDTVIHGHEYFQPAIKLGVESYRIQAKNRFFTEAANEKPNARVQAEKLNTFPFSFVQ